MRRRRLVGAAFVVILSTRVAGQSPTSNPASSPTPDSTGEAQTSSESASHDSDKRIFGIIPNYRTSPTLTDYTPLSPGTKYRLAEEDAFDRGTFILAGLFAGQSQWTRPRRRSDMVLAHTGVTTRLRSPISSSVTS